MLKNYVENLVFLKRKEVLQYRLHIFVIHFEHASVPLKFWDNLHEFLKLEILTMYSSKLHLSKPNKLVYAYVIEK